MRPSSVVERPSRLAVSVAPRSMFLPLLRCLRVKRPLPLVLKVLVPVPPARFIVSPMKLTLPPALVIATVLGEVTVMLMSATAAAYAAAVLPVMVMFPVLLALMSAFVWIWKPLVRLVPVLWDVPLILMLPVVVFTCTEFRVFAFIRTPTMVLAEPVPVVPLMVRFPEPLSKTLSTEPLKTLIATPWPLVRLAPWPRRLMLPPPVEMLDDCSTMPPAVVVMSVVPTAGLVNGLAPPPMVKLPPFVVMVAWCMSSTLPPLRLSVSVCTSTLSLLFEEITRPVRLVPVAPLGIVTVPVAFRVSVASEPAVFRMSPRN